MKVTTTVLKCFIPFVLCFVLLQRCEAQDSASGTLVRSEGLVKVQNSTFRGPSFHPQRDAVAPDGFLSGSSLGRTLDSQLLPWQSAQDGQLLVPGSTIETSEGGSATVALPGGGELYLYPSTRVYLLPQPGGPVRLEKGKAWLRSESGLRVLTPEGGLSLGLRDEVVVTAETKGVSLAVLSGEVSSSGLTVESGQKVSLTDIEAGFQPVQVQVERPKSRVGEATAPQSFLLPPFFATQELREQAREEVLKGDRESQIKVWLDEGRVEEAELALGSLVEGGSRALLATRLALLQGDFESAEEMASLSEDSPHSSFHKGLLAWREFRLEEAAREFTSAEEAGPAYGRAARSYLVEFQRGHYREAENLMSEALEAQPEVATWHRQLGDVYSSLSRNGSALDSYKKAQELAPEQSPQTALRVASLLTRMGRREESLKALEDYQQGSPDPEADVHYSLAAAFTALNQGQLNKAWELSEKALEASLTTDPGLKYLALDLQGLILSRRRQYGAAVEKYQDARQLSPADPFVLNNLALAMSRSGDLYEALEQLLKAKERAPESPTIRANLGIVYNLLGQPQRAQSELQQAVRLVPDNGRVLQELGLVLDNNSLEATGDRLIVQSSILEPQVIAPEPRQTFLSVQTDPFLDTRYGFGHSVNLDGVALGFFSVGEEEAEAALGDNSQESFLTLGTHLTERDRLWAKVGMETQRESVTELGVGGFERQAVAELGYYRELSPKTSLWALVGHGQAQEKFTPALSERPGDGVENSLGSSSAFELRLDHQLHPQHTLKGGLAYLDEFEKNTEFAGALVPESREDVDFRFLRFWIQDEWRMRDDLHLVGGLHFDQLNGRIVERESLKPQVEHQLRKDQLNPYFGLVYQPGPQTELSLGVTRESDISFLAHDEERWHQLAPTLLSNTSQFPLRVDELNRIEMNSLSGELLPVWDYRLQVRQGLGKNLFVTAEGFHTEVLPSDIQSTALEADFETGGFQDFDFGAVAREERSRLRGARVDLEFWDGGKTVGSVGYRYRDYRFDSYPFQGNRWRLTPEHEFDARILRQIVPGLTLELNPRWQSDVFLDRANTNKVGSKADLSPFIHWQPSSELLLSLGYRDLLTTSRRDPDRRGFVLRLFSRF